MPRPWLWVSLGLLACAQARSGHDQGVADPAAGSGDVSAADASQPVGPCRAHRERVERFLAQHSACERDTDCSVVGSCGGGFGFESVARYAATEAQALSDATPQGCALFDGPTFDAYCAHDQDPGVCALREAELACGERPRSLCNGSNEIRASLKVAGGFADTLNARADSHGAFFWFLDGHCTYYASAAGAQGVVSGALAPDMAESLAQALSYDSLDTGRFSYGGPCDDGQVTTLTTPAAAISCLCGCRGAPDMVQSAQAGALEWLSHLLAEGQPLDGAVIALAGQRKPAAVGDRAVYAWPLARTPDSIPGLIDDNTAAMPGARFDDPAEYEPLRMLRGTAHAATPDAPYFVVQAENRVFELYVRDALPQDTELAIRRFNERARGASER